jgi:AsmA protein
MTKAVKLTMLAVGIVAVLVIGAVSIFVATFDVNDYKERIADLIEEKTGRKLTFTGDIRMTYFPVLGVAVEGASLSNAAGFGETPMAKVRTAGIAVKIMPLFSGQVRFRRVFLDGLELSLTRNAEGISNWDDLTSRDTGAAPSDPSGKEGETSLELELAGLIVKDASLLWKDEQSGTSIVLGGINLDVGAIGGQEPFPVKGSLDFQLDRPDLRGSADVSATLSLDTGGSKVGMTDASWSAKLAGKDVPGGKGDVDITSRSAEYSLKTDAVAVQGMTVDAYGATLHFDGTLEGLADFKRLAGTMTVDPFDGRKVLANLGLPDPETGDPKALAGLEGTAKVAYTPNSLSLKDLDLVADGSTVKGDFKVLRDEAGMSWYARLEADTLDLDRYLLVRRKPVEAGKGPASKAKGDGKLLDAAAVRRLTLDTRAKVAKFHYRGVWMSNVVVAAKARNGLLRISPVTADLYGGTMSLDSTVNCLAKYPKIDILASLDKVDVGALSKDALGKAEYGGLLRFKGALSCEGDREETMLRSLNGKVSLHLADGVFPGVDLLGMARTTHERKDKSGTVEASDSDSTRFGSIDGKGVIASGVLNSRDLEVKAPGLRATGEGVVSLYTRKIDYLLKVKLVPTTEGQGGKSSSEMFGVMVPIRVGGTLDDPHYWVSLTEYVKALGGAVIGVAGTVLGGVKSAVTTVGKTITGSSGSEESKDGKETEKKKGIFNLFGLF